MKSKSSLKQRFLRAFAGGVLAAALLPASNAFAVSAFPSSGSCAMLVTQPVPVGANMPHNSGYNILAVLTFTSATAGTIDFYGVRVNYTITGYSVDPTPETGSAIPFTVGTLVPPAPSAARSITFTTAGGTLVANAIAVNGGSTVLIQGASDAFSGVCQF
jgi:hypothetical protein